ncbi:MAG: putative lipid II flippase FtsW [Woeseiaceae bacterium]|nr:putative lipid II flippase FtsW [Woeseiaceae bacterium]
MICLYIPIFYWERMGPFLLIVGLLLLLLVLLPGFGHTVNGSTRWLRMGIMNVQVSDPARLCIMIYVAGYLVRRNRQLREGFVGFLRPMIVLGLASLLLLLETDFGATAVLLVTVLSMLLVAGARIRDFLMFLVTTIMMLALLVMQFPSRMRRFTGFLDPWDESVVYSAGYQLSQSLIAIGRGEWLGVGLGNSVQKLFYLPEAHTDFIFAVFSEEFGLFGSIFLILLFTILIWRIFRLAIKSAKVDHFFEAYFCIGVGSWLGFQVAINLGVNMGLLPTKGLTLPLISYGRSSIIMTLVTLGILLRIYHELDSGYASKHKRKVRKR